MIIEVRTLHHSNETRGCIKQIEKLFEAELAPRGQQAADFESISRLFFTPTTEHPIFGGEQRPKRSYAKKSDTYFVDAQVDYVHFVSDDWPTRVDAYAEGIDRAVDYVAKTRLTQQERADLKAMVEETRIVVREQVPDVMVRAASIRVHNDADGNIKGVGLGSSRIGRGRSVRCGRPCRVR